ncbi:hypothetical protein CDL15_Pgr019275 [Punica granatum]|uniref:Uncharacterized protein n=1 Tax=Punica granatum TaxID=22663 RepID=A0A218Y107_PUNGR|nr:hypothetical protein CDL15_Pgr019275 [Punica granatum]
MATEMKKACMMISKSIHSDIYQDKFLELPRALRNVDGFPCESSTAFYVYVDDELVGSGEYRPKKEIAINRAAKNALEKLEILGDQLKNSSVADGS